MLQRILPWMEKKWPVWEQILQNGLVLDWPHPFKLPKLVAAPYTILIWHPGEPKPLEYKLSRQAYKYILPRYRQPQSPEDRGFWRAFHLICRIQATGEDWVDYVDREVERRGLS